MKQLSIIIVGLASINIMAQSLPENWWKQNSPEEVLSRAKSISNQLPFFYGENSHLQNAPKSSLEVFQRLTPNGTVERKTVLRTGSIASTEYELESGRYLIGRSGIPVKLTFEDDELEKSLAATLEHPYIYKFLDGQIVGTNKCLVLARIATPEFLQKLKPALYPNPIKFLGDPSTYMRSETDTYIRENDGVILGTIKKNSLGHTLDDFLCEAVQVNTPITSKEFQLPASPMGTATNMAQYLSLSYPPKSLPIDPQKGKLIRSIIIVLMIASSGILIALLFRFRHKE